MSKLIQMIPRKSLEKIQQLASFESFSQLTNALLAGIDSMSAHNVQSSLSECKKTDKV